MKNENSTRLNPLGVAWNAWLTERGGTALVAQRQRERLTALVRYARERSPLYADRYGGVP
jgi:hypothetical protein